MDECDPGAPLADQASSDRYPDYSHASFAYKLRVQILRSIVRALTMVWIFPHRGSQCSLPCGCCKII